MKSSYSCSNASWFWFLHLIKLWTKENNFKPILFMTSGIKLEIKGKQIKLNCEGIYHKIFVGKLSVINI
jgi:hypothetical protein